MFEDEVQIPNVEGRLEDEDPQVMMDREGRKLRELYEQSDPRLGQEEYDEVDLQNFLQNARKIWGDSPILSDQPYLPVGADVDWRRCSNCRALVLPYWVCDVTGFLNTFVA